MDKKELFADVILPLALPNAFTYSVPESLQKKIKVGVRVVVEFRTKKLYTALVCRIHENKPADYKTKPIENILDESPIVNETQLGFWKWMADYYLCTIGEVMNAALPSGLKLSSETKIMLNSSFLPQEGKLSSDEYIIYEALQTQNILTISDIAEIINIKKSHTVIKSLLEKNVILLQEELKEKFGKEDAFFENEEIYDYDKSEYLHVYMEDERV